MYFLIDASILIASYIFGSIPFGLIIVKLMTGRDVRTIASGRTGGTNAMRAAGLWAGLVTAILDILKSAATVWLAQAITTNVWIQVAAPIAANPGAQLLIFMIEHGSDGRVHLHGGAGGAATGGGALGFWPPAALILVPCGLLIWYGIGYASITTLSIGLMVIVIFGVRAALRIGSLGIHYLRRSGRDIIDLDIASQYPAFEGRHRTPTRVTRLAPAAQAG